MSTFITLCGRAIMSDIQVKRYGHSGVTDSDVTYVIITSREILELILYSYYLYKEILTNHQNPHFLLSDIESLYERNDPANTTLT